MSTSVKVLISIDPCCERLKFLSDILLQARNLSLSETYLVAVENLILEMMPSVSSQNEQGVIDLYDSNIDNILDLRNTAFNEWKDEVKSRHTPVPKTPVP